MKQLEVYLPIDKKSVKLGKKKRAVSFTWNTFFYRVFFLRSNSVIHKTEKHFRPNFREQRFRAAVGELWSFKTKKKVQKEKEIKKKGKGIRKGGCRGRRRS